MIGLSQADIAAIKSAIAKLPPLPDEALDYVAVMLAAFRDERRRQAATTARPSRARAARPARGHRGGEDA